MKHPAAIFVVGLVLGLGGYWWYITARKVAS
jgi:hypothetical protein